MFLCIQLFLVCFVHLPGKFKREREFFLFHVDKRKLSNLCGVGIWCTRKCTVFKRAWTTREHTRGDLGHFISQTTILPTIHERVENSGREHHEIHPRNHETRMPHGTFVHAQENEHAKLRQIARKRNEDDRDHRFIHATVRSLFTRSVRSHVLEDKKRNSMIRDGLKLMDFTKRFYIELCGAYKKDHIYKRISTTKLWTLILHACLFMI